MRLKLSLIILLLASTVSPAFAGRYCYHYNGQTVCCTSYGNQVWCS